jgi:D-xylose 1-dehydrogenase
MFKTLFRLNIMSDLSVATYIAADNRDAIFPSLKGKRIAILLDDAALANTLRNTFAAQGSEVFIFCAIPEETFNAPLTSPLTDIRRIAFCAEDYAALETHLKSTFHASGLDALIIGSAHTASNSLQKVTLDTLDQVLVGDFHRQIRYVLAALPVLEKADAACIISIGASFSGITTSDNPLLPILKGALETFTADLAKCLDDRCIRVCTILTNYSGKVHIPNPCAYAPRNAYSGKHIFQPAQARHVASMALFLCSDDGAGCSGYSYFVDGPMQPPPHGHNRQA